MARRLSEEDQKREAIFIMQQRAKLREFIATTQQQRIQKALLASLLDKSARSIALVVDDELKPRTNGETVWVSLLPSLLKEDKEEYWGVYLRPLNAHETQHCNSSDFDDVKEIREWFGAEMEKNGFDKRIGISIASDFHNAMEDGRIEQIAADRRPGLVIPFRFLNDCIREGCEIPDKAIQPQDEFHDFFGQVLSYCKTGLYAPGIEYYAGSEMETFFLATRDYIDNAINARTSLDCRLAAQSFLIDCMPYIGRLLEESPELQQELKGQENINEYEGAKETQFNNGGSSKGEKGGEGGNKVRADSPEGFGHFNKDKNGGTGQEPEGISDAEGTNYGFAEAGGNVPEKGYSEQDLADMEQSIRTSIQVAQAQAVQEGLPPEMDGLSDEEIKKLCEEAYGSANDSFREEWLKYPEVTLPGDLQMEAATLRKELLKLFQTRKAVVTGRKSGILDVKQLWKTGVGEKDVFYRPGRKDMDSCAFYLLIDNSGSMSESCARNVTKSFAARRAAAVIEEALKGIVPLKIALFTALGGSRHISLKTFDSRAKTNACYASLKAIQPTGGNADSVHIRVAAKELQNRKERKKFLFVLSDGMPSAYAGRMQGEEEVRKAVEDARKNGVMVIPIMFGSDEFRSQYHKAFEKMYSKNIVSCDPNEISKRLPNLFRQLISMN